MLEVSADSLTGSNVAAGLSYGGDTLNTALYYARMGGAASYVTALGDDSLSAWMLDQWRGEGIGCEFVARDADAAPGLYLIQLDEHGERSFVYWRENSAARMLLQNAERLTRLLTQATTDAGVLYLSGITLALMSREAREAFLGFAAGFRERGGQIAFDSNHRPRLWPDTATARAVYEQMYSCTDIALSTADDEYSLFEGHTPNDIVERLRSLNVAEVVVKNGNEGCVLHAAGVTNRVPALAVDVVDTTAAGDSFNAAYLLSRAVGLDAVTAVHSGHALASTVIGHRGAIIPKDAMPEIAGLSNS